MRAPRSILDSALGHGGNHLRRTDIRQLRTDNAECYRNIIKSRRAYMITLIMLIIFPWHTP
jgi:hypothetical protein